MVGTERNPAAVIVFTIITCGIYAMVWIYKFASELKEYLGNEEISPGLELFLCIICFPYLIYWSYKYGKYINDAERMTDIQSGEDDSILYLILAVFGLFIVNMAIMQDKMNAIWAKNR